MKNRFRLENIEDMRRRKGIEDAELSEQIRGLAAGNLVRLTFLTEEKSTTAETLPVRITSIRGSAFRGKLVTGPASAALAEVQVGMLFTFTAGHIHSLVKEPRVAADEATHRRRAAKKARAEVARTA